MIMTDSNERDEKIIAIAKNDPFMNCYKEISEIPEHVIAEIMHFFEVYKQLEGKKTTVDEMLGSDKAKEIIENCMNNYREKFGE